MDEKQLQALYDAVSQHFDIGSYDDFKSHMITPEDRKNFYTAVNYKGFDLGDYNEYEQRLGGVKKKDTTPLLSEAISKSGSKATQSISEPLSSLGNQIIKGSNQFQNKIDANDPVKSFLNPFKQTQQEAIQRAAIPVSESTGQTFLSPANQYQANIQQQTEPTLGRANENLGNATAIAKKTLFPTGKNAKDYLTSKIIKNGSLDPNNETENLAVESKNEYDNLYKGISANGSIEKAAISDRINSDENFKQQVAALQKEGLDIPRAMQGQIIANYLYDNKDNLKDLVQEHPELQKDYEDLTKNFLTKYPETADAIVANKISQAREKLGYNSAVANFNTNTFKKHNDQIAGTLSPEEQKVWENDKDKITGMLDTGGMLNRFEEGIEGGWSATKGLFNRVTLQNTHGERLSDEMIKQATGVTNGETGWKKALGTATNFAGTISYMMAGGGIGQGAGLSPAAAEGVMNVATFADPLFRDAESKYPNNPFKATLSGMANMIAFASLSPLKTGQISDALSNIRPAINDAIKDLPENATVNEAKKTILGAVEKGLKQYGTSVIEMGLLLPAFNQGMDMALGLDQNTFDKYHHGEFENSLRNIAIGAALPAVIRMGGEAMGARNRATTPPTEEPTEQETTQTETQPEIKAPKEEQAPVSIGKKEIAEQKPSTVLSRGDVENKTLNNEKEINQKENDKKASEGEYGEGVGEISDNKTSSTISNEVKRQIVEIEDWGLPADELSRNAAYIPIKGAMRDGDIVAINKNGEEMSIKNPSQVLSKTKQYQYNPEIDYFKAKTDKGRQILSQLNAEYVAREVTKNIKKGEVGSQEETPTISSKPKYTESKTILSVEQPKDQSLSPNIESPSTEVPKEQPQAISSGEQKSASTGLSRGDEKIENNEVSKKYFSEEAFKKAREQEDNEEGVLVMMPIDDFLAVNPIHKEGEKTKLVADLAESGTKYNEIPFLTYTHTPNGTAIVQGHEGRHRAAELKKRGETVMPVLMKNVYQNENMGRDYVTKKSLADPNAFNEETSGKFPEKLHGASDGRKNTVPFPITREGKSKFGNSDENGAVKEMTSTAAPAKDQSLSPNIEPQPQAISSGEGEKTDETKTEVQQPPEVKEPINTEVSEDSGAAKATEEGEGNTVGVSDANLTDLAKRLGLKKPERGEYFTPEQYANRGRKLLSEGANPNEVDNPNNALHDRISIARAHLENLVKDADAIAKSKGTDSKEYEKAWKEVNEYTDKVKGLGTEAHRAMTALQGERDIDTNSFTNVSQAFKDETGNEPNKEQTKKIKDLTDQNQKLKERAEEAEKKLVEATNKSMNEPTEKTTKGKFEKKARGLADKIMKSELPSWLKVDDPNIKKQGLGIDDAKKLLADATIKMGQLLDKGMEFAEAVKEAVKDLIDAFGEGKRNDIEKGFIDHYNNLVDEKAKNLEDLQKMFVDKNDKKFSIEQSKSIWEYAKKHYLEKGYSYREMIGQVSNDLGLSWRQVSDAITSPKTKRISDEMWKKQADYRRNQNATKHWIDSQSKSPYIKTLRKVSGAFRGVSVFGHGGIFVGTHAGMTFFNPSHWKYTIPAFFRGWKFAYGNKGDYERRIEELKNSPNYVIAQRAGLKNNPDNIHAEEYQKSQQYLGKLGLAGERGFNAIKILRQNLFDYHYNRLSDEAKQDPESVEQIAKLINNATGATNLKLPDWVNETTFAGGMEAARWGKLTRNPARATAIAIKALITPEKATTAERVFARVWARRVGEQIGTMAGTLLANAALQSVINPKNPVNLTNPNQSDYLKFKFGNTTIDPTSGMRGAAMFIYGMGKVPFMTKKELRGDTRMQALGKNAATYGRGKLAPLYSTIADFFTQQDFNKNPMPFSQDKPTPGHHKLSWLEYGWEKAPLPIAHAAQDMYHSALDNGGDKMTVNHILNGIVSGALSGGTGFRVGEYEPRPTPFNDEDYNKYPAFKKVKEEWKKELPNTSLKYEKVKNSGGKVVSDYSQDIQDKYLEAHKDALEKELEDVFKWGKVYVDKDGAVSLAPPSAADYTIRKVDNLTDDEQAQVLKLAQSNATEAAKDKVFYGKKTEEQKAQEESKKASDPERIKYEIFKAKKQLKEQ